MLTTTGKKYRPVGEGIADSRFIPGGIKRLLRGETRVYGSPLTPAECLARLDQHLTASQLRPGQFKAIGEVDTTSFLFRLRGGFSDDSGVAPYLYGVIFVHNGGSRIVALKALPRVIALAIAWFNVLAFLALLVLGDQLVRNGQRFSDDVFGGVIIVGLLPAVVAIDTFGFFIVRAQMRMKHFEFMADLVDAYPVFDDSIAKPTLTWRL